MVIEQNRLVVIDDRKAYESENVRLNGCYLFYQTKTIIIIKQQQQQTGHFVQQVIDQPIKQVNKKLQKTKANTPWA